MLTDKPWRVDAAGRLLLALLASLFLGSWIAKLFGVKPGDDFATLVISTLCFHAASLFFVHLFLFEHRTPWSAAFGFRESRRVRSLLIALGTLLVALPCAWVLYSLSSYALTWVGVRPVPQQAVTAIRSTVAVGPLVYMAVMAVVVVPLSEELLFRGILYPLLKRETNRWLAWAATSLLFGAMHFNLATFVPLAFLGVLLAAEYEATGNLLVPFLTHSLFNLANFWLIAYLQSQAWLGPLA